MSDLNFNSVSELYDRLLPALKIKVNSLKKLGYSFIDEEKLFKILAAVSWSNFEGLELCDMVDQILHISPDEVLKHYNMIEK